MKKLVFLFTILACVSCKRNLLDVPSKDKIAEDAVWSSEGLIKAYEAEMYNGVPHGFYIHMYSKFTDEAVNFAPCCGADIVGQKAVTPDNVGGAAGGDFWGSYLYYWDRGYLYIRKANVFLDKMATSTVQISNKAQLIAEAKFLRAFYYFNLIERFGGVPIVTKAYDLPDAVNATVSFKRNTYDECVAQIQKDLSEAMPDLPVKIASSDAAFGRATQDAAKALLSRTLLYAASKLNNPSHDNAKWQKAADAAQALLNSGYSLYPDYRKEFILKSGDANSELIFAREFTSTNGHQAPMHNLNRRYGAYGGWWGSNGPSQNLVDDYDMANGEPVYNDDGAGNKTLNPLSGYDPQHPYANRDPRFDMTIIHDESVYRGDTFEMWVSSDGKTNGFDNSKVSGDNPTSNYVFKKFFPDADVPLSFQNQYTNPWPFFRLGEIYLNYAEAKFELGDEATCRQYINMVRARVGMPGLPATVTGEALRVRLYNERRIELAMEGHRYFDLRRWKLATIYENKPMKGMQIIKDVTTGVKTYTPVTLLVRPTVTDAMNVLPIDRSEQRRNKDLTQAPGYN